MTCFKKAAVSTNRVFQLLAVRPEITDAPRVVAPKAIAWDVHLDGLTFGYDPAVPVLHDIDIYIGEGEILALVGPTGAGKSTVANLLPRFYDPQRGAVRIGGHDLRDMPIAFVRENIASVLQDVVSVSWHGL